MSEGCVLVGDDQAFRPATTGRKTLTTPAALSGRHANVTFNEPGTYPVVSQIMVDAERGAPGLVRVTP